MEDTFVIGQTPLSSLLASAQPMCAKRTTLDVTSSILFQVSRKELSLKATDLEISLHTTCPLKEGSSSDGSCSFLVPGRRMFDLVKELDGDVTFSLEDNQLMLQSGGARLSLNVKDPADFPPFPERIENMMAMDASFLLDMLNKVSFLIPQNNANPALNGLYLEITSSELRMTSTDGHCLVQVRTKKYTLEESRSWLIPRRAVFEMKKLLESSGEKPIFLGTCSNQLVISGESFNLFTKVLADGFPQYEEIVATEGFSPAKLDRSHFVKTLRRSACLLSGQFVATVFDFDKDGLNVSMQNKEVGQLHERVPLFDFSGEAIDVRFFAPYLLSGLQAFSDEQVRFYLKSASKPIIFEAQNDDIYLLYLVMPVAPTNES